MVIFSTNSLNSAPSKLKKSRILRAEYDLTIQRTQELLDILEEGPDLLMTFDAALFSQLVAAGYKNVRIDDGLLLELGQQSFLTCNICDSIVE